LCVPRAAELTVEMPAASGYNTGVNERLRITMTMTIYHGSQNEIQRPRFGFGAADNDYGQGFYCTESFDSAGEWAVYGPNIVEPSDGYINEYTFETDGLRILNLLDEDIDRWISILMKYRGGNYTQAQGVLISRFIAEHYKGAELDCDVVLGWRADDKYFRMALDYVLLRDKDLLRQAVKLANLGEQVFIRTEEAFKRIRWVKSHAALVSRFYETARRRDVEARAAYDKLVEGHYASKGVS
jgi:hypothetical protein